ncbi:MAG: biopolymer transporter ExbD [Gemmatales bacterium]|nr:biopolymer transporter ExbD [Gemmatales bacterium]MCS7159516.1 biopolymer transporter ExbD [Gemmatales bacterium]MDW8174715.1 biopolymer transporter ExbD [Gemmatales bacterium]MDW8222965.1 biopolymer transporter ExbD [Gemmatales bacterium]
MAAAVGSEERMELNLTPLLDVVLQLIMFFMMCVNFVMDQVDPNVLLPSSVSARELPPKTDIQVIVVNMEVVREDVIGPDGKPVRDPKTGKVVRTPISPRTTKVSILTYRQRSEGRMSEEERRSLEPKIVFLVEQATDADLEKVSEYLVRIGYLPRDNKQRPEAEQIKVLPEGNGLATAQRFLANIARAIEVTDPKKVTKLEGGRRLIDVPVILRADRDALYGTVTHLIAQCNFEGFKKVDLRATIHQQKPTAASP